MKKTLLYACLILTFLLSACSGAPAQNQTNTQAAPNTSNSPGTAYPTGSYPAPDEKSAALATSIVYPAKPDDGAMNKSTFTVDKVDIKQNPNNAKLIDIWVTGSMPSSCDNIRVNAAPPDSSNNLKIDIFSLRDKDATCDDFVQKFNGVVATVGGYPAGKYMITVNGKSIGNVTIQ